MKRSGSEKGPPGVRAGSGQDRMRKCRWMVYSANRDEDPNPYHIQEYPDTRKKLVGEQPETLKRTFSGCRLGDPGDPLPDHWSALDSRVPKRSCGRTTETIQARSAVNAFQYVALVRHHGDGFRIS